MQTIVSVEGPAGEPASPEGSKEKPLTAEVAKRNSENAEKIASLPGLLHPAILFPAFLLPAFLSVLRAVASRSLRSKAFRNLHASDFGHLERR